MAKKKKQLEIKAISKKFEEEVKTSFIPMYRQEFPDGNMYQLLISQDDHKWYKAKEIGKFQRDTRNNSPWIYRYDEPVLLTNADIEYLDNKKCK